MRKRPEINSLIVARAAAKRQDLTVKNQSLAPVFCASRKASRRLLKI
jgi:hypothetical protein